METLKRVIRIIANGGAVGFAVVGVLYVWVAFMCWSVWPTDPDAVKLAGQMLRMAFFISFWFGALYRLCNDGDNK